MKQSQDEETRWIDPTNCSDPSLPTSKFWCNKTTSVSAVEPHATQTPGTPYTSDANRYRELGYEPYTLLSTSACGLHEGMLASVAFMSAAAVSHPPIHASTPHVDENGFTLMDGAAAIGILLERMSNVHAYCRLP